MRGFLLLAFQTGFNTQPPKGGWRLLIYCGPNSGSFNTQPPKGGWFRLYDINLFRNVSTHSRLKAAGYNEKQEGKSLTRFNTQPPKGGWKPKKLLSFTNLPVSTHSRLKAAGSRHLYCLRRHQVSTHSRLKAAVLRFRTCCGSIRVSTHSRLKAAVRTVRTSF